MHTRRLSTLLGIALYCSLFSSIPHAAINEGLVAYYDFESANVGADASGNNHTLDNNGGVPGEGIKGNGLLLDGFGWLETSAATDFDTTTDFTWSVWFMIDDEELPGGILSKSPVGWLPGAKALFKGEESFLGFDVGWVGAAEFEGDITDGEWHHAVSVGTFPADEDIGIVELYVDGELVSEMEGGASEFTEPEGSVFRIGSGSPGDINLGDDGEAFPEVATFSGFIDEVRVYNRSLDFEDIKALLIDGFGGLTQPEILQQPADAQGIVGRNLTLSAQAKGLFLEYQWSKDSVEIVDATGPTLILEEIAAGDAGSYSVRISNEAGDVQSSSAAVTLLDEWSLDTNLLAHWNFDTAGQPGKDASGNSNDLDNFGAIQGTGIKGQALDLDRDGRLEDTDENLPFNTLQDFTWTAFVKTQEDGSIIAKSPGDFDVDGPGTWAPGSKALFIREDRLGFDTGWIGDVDSGQEISDGEWHHVGISVDLEDGEDTVRLWVDGNPDGLWEGVDLEEQPDVGTFFIGYSSDDFPNEGDTFGNWFFGQIDEVRVYTQALIQEDIVKVFIEDGGTVDPPSIVEQPSSRTVIAGRTARLSVSASGTGVVYQWTKNGNDIEDATEALLVIENATKADAGEYSVVVSSEHVEPAVTSEVVTLTVEDAPVFSGGELASVGPFLESYWNFDNLDADGLVPDLSPIGSHHGDLVNGAALTSGNQGFGGAGEALNAFDGEGAHMAASGPESYDFNSDFTWSARIKLFEPALSGGEVGSGIFGRSPAESDHNQGSKILYVTGQNIGFDTGWVGAVTTVEEVNLDQWHQVTMTYLQEEDLISIWLNDEVVSTEEGEEIIDFEFNVDEFPEDVEFNGGVVNTGFRVGGGAREGTTPFFDDPFPGLIDDAAVWSTVLSEEQIILLANGASPLPELSDAPTIGIIRVSGTITLEYTGNLESADDPEGTWETVAGATSPFAVDTTAGPMKYYRSVQ